MSLAQQAIRDIQRMLKSVGSPLTYTQVSQGAFDPAQGAVVGSGVQTFTPLGVLLSYSAQEVDNSTVLRSDRKALIQAGVGFVPRPGDHVTDASGTWTVKDYGTYDLNGVVLLYWCQVRRGP